MRYGSLINMIMPNRAAKRGPDGKSVPVEPAAGVVATMIMFSDRHAGRILEVRRIKTGPRAGEILEILWQQDNAIRTDPYGESDAQSYRYEPDPNGAKRIFTARPGGVFIAKGQGARGWRLAIGIQDEHYDYTR